MKKPGRKIILSIIYCFLFVMQAFALEPFLRGERLFRENKPAEALPFLLEATTVPNPDPAVYNYLGLAYTQLKQYDAAIEAFTRGVEAPFSNVPLLYFNAGNAAFFAGNYPLAEELYTKSFDADPFYAKAVLNRANTNLKQLEILDALDDYTLYIQLDPASPQRPQIQQMIALLNADIQTAKNQEMQRQAQEMARVEAEAEKARISEQLAIEQARRDAERQKLLEQISSSLKSSDSTNISAGSEGVLEYTYEPKLE